MEKQRVLRALAALSQESRLDIFRLLVQSGPEGIRAGSIATRLDIPPATLSFHLKELKNAGIVQQRQDGRSRIYSPDFRAIQHVLEFLSRNCCEGYAKPTDRGGRRSVHRLGSNS